MSDPSHFVSDGTVCRYTERERWGVSLSPILCVCVCACACVKSSPAPSDQRDREQGREEAVYGAVEKTAAIGHYRSQVPLIPIPIPIVLINQPKRLIG